MFGTQKWPLGHFEVARGLARSRIAHHGNFFEDVSASFVGY